MMKLEQEPTLAVSFMATPGLLAAIFQVNSVEYEKPSSLGLGRWESKSSASEEC